VLGLPWDSPISSFFRQQQQCIYLKKYKVYNTLCPANSYNANLGTTRLSIKTLLNYIRKKKEIQKHTERNTLHINSSTGDFAIWKSRLSLIMTNPGLNIANRGINFIPRLDSVPESSIKTNLGIN